MATSLSRLSIALALLAVSAAAQGPSQADFSPAHLCSRCHLHGTLEWSVSAHNESGTGCTACHGPSEGHLLDERNNIKPDRVPRGAAVASLCQGCHQPGCPKTKRTDACQSCHHVHALVDVRDKPAAAQQPAAEDGYQVAMERGKQLIAASDLEAALREFETALAVRPADTAAVNRVAFCRRRLNPRQAGFRILDDAFDPDSGLPLRVETTALGIGMILVPGGKADIGDQDLPDSRLVHTVRVEPFYLARFEVTQELWLEVMGANPSSYTGDGQMPVESVSWADSQRFVARVNATVEGGGFHLPTEAEWEYAVRKGLRNADLETVAWYRDNSRVKDDPQAEPAELNAPRAVGRKHPNTLGLHDMRGNVWEWCSSLLRPYPYNAADGREDPQADGLRVLRGGSFTDRAGLLAPGYRHGERPNRRFRWNGLRLARSAP